MSPRRSTTRTAAILVVLIVLATGCQYRFGIVGDSITQDAREELTARKGHVRAFGGVDIRAGRPELRRMARSGYPVVVSALGSFDVAYGASSGTLRRRLRNAMRETASVPCVIWLEQNENPNIHPGWPPRAATFNTVLRRVAANQGVHVAPWSRKAAQRRDWFRADGIHLRPVGQRGYAAFVTRSVNQFC